MTVVINKDILLKRIAPCFPINLPNNKVDIKLIKGKKIINKYICFLIKLKYYSNYNINLYINSKIKLVILTFKHKIYCFFEKSIEILKWY